MAFWKGPEQAGECFPCGPGDVKTRVCSFPVSAGGALEGGGRERGDVAGAGPVSPPAHGSLCSLGGVSTGGLSFDQYVLVVESGHARAPGRN